MITTIISWNVNGLRQRHKLNQFTQIFRHNPEIVCIQETKTAHENVPGDLKKIAGYSTWFAPVKKGDFAEVALFSRREPLSVSYGFGNTPFDKEGRIIVADYGVFVLLNIYFPLGVEPTDNLLHKLAFYDAFLAYVKKLNDEKRYVIVCGDFSIAHTDKDVFNPKKKPSKQVGTTPKEREKIDQLIASGFVDTFRLFDPGPGHYSWWPNGFSLNERNNGWRLDYFFANELVKPQVKTSEILSGIEGSDHCPVQLEIEVPESIPKKG
jgi:exodeoxyribonuclease III